MELKHITGFPGDSYWHHVGTDDKIQWVFPKFNGLPWNHATYMSVYCENHLVKNQNGLLIFLPHKHYQSHWYTQWMLFFFFCSIFLSLNPISLVLCSTDKVLAACCIWTLYSHRSLPALLGNRFFYIWMFNLWRLCQNISWDTGKYPSGIYICRLSFFCFVFLSFFYLGIS